MKRVAVISMMAFVALLSGCGLSDPWKTWENEGELPSDRLLPSELKETLCLSDWWKVSYMDEDFYFQFLDDGTAESNSTILRDGVATTYYINWEEPYELKLTIVGGGHLGYLESGKEETLTVTSFDDAGIVCKGSESGAEMTLVPATASDYKEMLGKKAEAYKIAEYAGKITDEGMASGAIWNSGKFVARFHIDLSVAKSYSVRFDILEDGVLTHRDVAASLGADGKAALASGVSVAGKTISSIAFNVEDRTISVDNGMTAAVNDCGAWFTGKVSGYGTYEIRRDGSRGAASKAIWDEIVAAGKYSWGTIEVSDRTGRPFFCCPDGTQTDGQWYVGVYSVDSPYVSDTEPDRVYFTGGTRTEMPFGGDGKWADWIVGNHPLLISTWTSTDGLIVVKDGDEGLRRIWLLSPVDENWYMAEKD